MAIKEQEDFVFVPYVEIVMDNACMLCTKEYIYVIMDEVQINLTFWKEFVLEHEHYASIQREEKTPRDVIHEICEHPDATIDCLHSFLSSMAEMYQEGVNMYCLEKLSRLKIQKGIFDFGGNITAKLKGKGYHVITSKIPKPFNVKVKEYYAA